jgi:hypothetical protein
MVEYTVLVGHWRRLQRITSDLFYVATETGAHHVVLRRMGALSASMISYVNWPEAARHTLF